MFYICIIYVEVLVSFSISHIIRHANLLYITNHLEWIVVECGYSVRFSVTQQIILHLTSVHSVMPTFNLTLTHSTVTFDLLYWDNQRTIQKLKNTARQKDIVECIK